MVTRNSDRPVVVVIDDEESIREGCLRTLEGRGYRTAAAADGARGLRLVGRAKPQVILVDLRMPGMSGMEVLQRICELDPDGVSIVMTGYGSIPSAVEAMRNGAHDYLEKPLTPDRLIEVVDEAMPLAEAKLGKGSRLPEKDHAEGALIRFILRKASRYKEFARKLEYEGQRELSGWGISSESRRAILAGDTAWLTSICGELAPEEREWLEKRPW